MYMEIEITKRINNEGKTFDCFGFLRGTVAELINVAPMLRQLFLQYFVLVLKMNPWADFNPQY